MHFSLLFIIIIVFFCVHSRFIRAKYVATETALKCFFSINNEKSQLNILFQKKKKIIEASEEYSLHKETNVHPKKLTTTETIIYLQISWKWLTFRCAIVVFIYRTINLQKKG